MIHLLDVCAELKVLPQIVARKGDGAAGVLFFRVSQQVSGETDLCLYLLFAVAKVIIGNQRNHDPRGITANQLEAAAVVVALVCGFPAHSVPFLAVSGLRNIRQAKLFFAN